MRLPRVALGLALLLASAGCEPNPLTGRQELLLLSEAQEQQMGLQAFQSVIQKERISRDPQVNAFVQRVGRRIAAATGRSDYQWEFKVVDKNEVNAFCLPGGKVVVYSGLLPVARDDAGLAAIIGHEVAHAIARHGGERVSQNMLVGIGVDVLSAALAKGDPNATQQVANLLGAGAEVGVTLPFSRTQESEADYMGLVLMTKAGYDPRAALALWQRMAQSNHPGVPEFLSTHPADETRIRQIAAWIPEVEAKYGGRGN